MYRSSLFIMLCTLGMGCSSKEPSTETPSANRAVISDDGSTADLSSVIADDVALKISEVPSSDGVIVRYESRGTGEPTLVFIHGWCCNRTFWEPQLAHFEKTHRVIAIDLAGHGESDKGRTQWTMEAFGKDVAAIVANAAAERVILIGHSMGGPVILEAAPLVGEHLVGLVGVDTFTDPNESYTDEQMSEFRRPFEDDFPKAMRDALNHGNDFFCEQTTGELKDRITAAMTSAPPEMGVGAFQGMLDFANERQRPLMAQVKVPFVCINARVNPEKVADGKQHAPQFEVLTIPDSGHFLMMEHPAEFNALLGDVIEKMISD